MIIEKNSSVLNTLRAQNQSPPLVLKTWTFEDLIKSGFDWDVWFKHSKISLDNWSKRLEWKTKCLSQTVCKEYDQ